MIAATRQMANMAARIERMQAGAAHATVAVAASVPLYAINAPYGTPVRGVAMAADAMVIHQFMGGRRGRGPAAVGAGAALCHGRLRGHGRCHRPARWAGAAHAVQHAPLWRGGPPRPGAQPGQPARQSAGVMPARAWRMTCCKPPGQHDLPGLAENPFERLCHEPCSTDSVAPLDRFDAPDGRGMPRLSSPAPGGDGPTRMRPSHRMIFECCWRASAGARDTTDAEIQEALSACRRANGALTAPGLPGVSAK